MCNQIRVLYVDDESAFADLTATALEREDSRFVVDTATSAGDGIDRLDAGEYDCVVSDYKMPDTNGLEFLGAVRETFPDLPFVLFTGEGSEAVASEALRRGATDYLQKSNGAEQYELLADRIVDAVAQTRERQVEDEPDAVYERMSYALEVTDSIIYEVDLESGTEVHHGPFEQLFGVASDQVATTEQFYELCVHPDDRERVERAQTRPIGDQTGTVSFEFRTHPDRVETRWLYSEAYVSTSPDGEPRRLVGLDTDITGLKRREQDLRRLKKEYESVFENARDSLFQVEVAGAPEDPEFRLSRVNPANAALIDIPAEAVRGSTPRELFDEAVGSDIAAKYKRCLEREEPISYEEQLPVDGECHTFETTLTPVEVDGTVTQIVGVSHDVTERERRERELKQQNERLEEFAAVVSHDLRNPLNVAEGRVELARQACDCEHLADAAEALGRMRTLIEDLLVLAREGQATVEAEPIELARAVERCWQTVDTTGATLDVGTDGTVRADRGRLRQLLENLFGNAVSHGGEGVTVAVGDLENGFYVADDGPGVPAEKRERVFETGYTDSAEGTGFGLAIVEEVATAHGWEVSLGASEAGGARFEVTGVDGE